MGCNGCELWNSERRSCYAGLQHAMYGGVRRGYSPTFSDITFWPGRMAAAARLSDLRGLRRNEKPWLDGRPRMLFIGDMGDVLCGSVPFEYLRGEIIDIVVSHYGRRHNWLMLSNCASRMADFSDWLAAQGVPWPANLGAGTTITSNETTRRIDELLRVGNDDTLHFVSVEPQLEPLDLRPWLPHLDWVIEGGESGRLSRKFDIAWARRCSRIASSTAFRTFSSSLEGTSSVAENESGSATGMAETGASGPTMRPTCVRCRFVGAIPQHRIGMTCRRPAISGRATRSWTSGSSTGR